MPRLHVGRLLPLLLLAAAVGIAYAYRQTIFSSDLVIDKKTSEILKSLETDESVDRQFTRKIVAVGDIHADYANARKVLQMAEVIDENGNWSGKVDIFVQTGDIIDRGDDTIKLFLWMEQLRSQARHVGGEVVSHLGNHEWMNLLGDWRYVYQSEIRTFGSVEARQKMLQTGRIGRAWWANYTVASRIPLHPSMGSVNEDYMPPNEPEIPTDNTAPSALSRAALSFVHGGLSPTYPHLTPYPSRINEIGKDLLLRLLERPFPPPHPPNPYSGLPDDATPEEKGLYGNDGPLWYRGWAMEDDQEVCSSVDIVLRKIGVRRLVMGHTPDFEKIVSRCGGKIIIIDTGMSHAYGGALSALSIKYTLTPQGNSKVRWTEREIISAVYPNQHEILVAEEREVLGEF